MTSPILSFVVYDGDGSTRDWTFDFGYLDRDHIKVYVDEVGSGAFTWTGPFSIRFYAAPANKTKIRIARETPAAKPLVTIANGSSLRAEDLNRQALQSMYVGQESADIATLMRSGALIAPTTDAGRVTLQFPSIEARKGNVLGFDQFGQFRPFTSADMPKGETGDKGPVGNQGPAGPQGSQGPEGPQGPRGPAGSNYSPDAQGLTLGRAAWDTQPRGFSYLDIQLGKLYWKLSATSGDWSAGVNFGEGAQGIQGVQGPQGPVGSQGPTGATGEPGSPGLIWRGAYSEGTAYTPKDVVSYNGSSYVNTLASTGVAPTSTSNWAPVAMKGDQGVQGIQGNVGPTGPIGMTFKGAWSAATAYSVNDAVTYNFSSYIAVAAGSNKAPSSNPTYWSPIAIGYDGANVVYKNVDAALGAGYTVTYVGDGAQSSGTYTCLPTNSNMRLVQNAGAFTWAADSDVTPKSYTIVCILQNTATAGPITFTGFRAVTGDTLTTVNGALFVITLVKHGGVKTLNIQAI